MKKRETQLPADTLHERCHISNWQRVTWHLCHFEVWQLKYNSPFYWTVTRQKQKWPLFKLVDQKRLACSSCNMTPGSECLLRKKCHGFHGFAGWEGTSSFAKLTKTTYKTSSTWPDWTNKSLITDRSEWSLTSCKYGSIWVDSYYISLIS